MSEPILELSFLPLRSGADIHDPSTETGKTFQEFLAIVAKTPVPGRLCTAWGQEAGELNNIRAFSCWDGIEVHVAAAQNETQQLLTRLVMSMVARTPEAYYTGVDTAFFNTLVEKRATVEVINLSFKPDDEDGINQAKDSVQRFAEATGPGGDGFYGSSWGWSLEMGKTLKGWAVISGWRDSESCLKFRNAAGIEDLRQIPGLVQMYSYFVPLQPFAG